MKSKGQNQKITHVITISQNYKSHRMNLEAIRPVIDSINKRRQAEIDRFSSARLKHRQYAREFQSNMREIENNRIVSRLTKIAKEDRKKRYSQFSIYSSNQMGMPLNSSRTSKRLKSSESSISLHSVSSNFRRRTLREQQIQRQNIQIAKRISNPKTVRALALSQLNKSYAKQQQIMKTRSRYSQKNQKIIKSLALQGLKFDKKDVQYLPQLAPKRKKSMSKLEYY